MEVTQQAFAQSVFHLDHPTHAAEARRFAVRQAEEIGMSESKSGAVAIAVTEIAGNVIKHAESGKILFEHIHHNGRNGLRVLAFDKGPGIADVTAALQDGFSTAGTNGNGLGAVRRLASYFDLYSVPGRGTCILAEFWSGKKPPDGQLLGVGAISIPLRGEPVCGDGWAIRRNGSGAWLLVVDGLGHGSFAADAAREAERAFAESGSESPAIILNDIHDALKKTRGAAAAIAYVNQEKQMLCFAGLGNISATLATAQTSRGIASHNGTLGHQMYRIQEFNLPWNEDSVLIMHSDGLSSRWDLSESRGIWSRHPSLIASVLYRDFAKERDDVTVLVARNC
jgi:anti-sigma regulatory factor (Ser/Thr protein kinase)